MARGALRAAAVPPGPGRRARLLIVAEDIETLAERFPAMSFADSRGAAVLPAVDQFRPSLESRAQKG